MKHMWTAAILGAALAGVVPVAAHHSFAVQYDTNKPTAVKGAVTKVEWTNPHARVYVDVKLPGGELQTWNFEMASPNVLARNGWKRDTLKAGDQITATLRPNKFGTPVGLLSRANMMVNGKALQIGPEQ